MFSINLIIIAEFWSAKCLQLLLEAGEDLTETPEEGEDWS
jgi:hypothetical protein